MGGHVGSVAAASPDFGAASLVTVIAIILVAVPFDDRPAAAGPVNVAVSVLIVVALAVPVVVGRIAAVATAIQGRGVVVVGGVRVDVIVRVVIGVAVIAIVIDGIVMIEVAVIMAAGEAAKDQDGGGESEERAARAHE